MKQEGGLRPKGAFAKVGTGDMPLVTIITVTKNSEAHLQKTIDSVTNQTYSNIEYIIIDGGSEDGTLDIIRRNSERIAYWISEEDSGLYHAMNKGVTCSTGTILGIVNSDDWYEKDAVRNAVDSFFLNPGAGLVHGNLISRTMAGEIDALLRPRSSWFAVYVSLPIFHPTCFVRRDVYDMFGTFDPKYRIVADYDLYLRFFQGKVGFVHIDKPLSNMRQGGASNRHENFWVTVRESWTAKKNNGLNYPLSFLGLVSHIFKYFIYRALMGVRFKCLVKLYRSTIR